MGGGVSLMEGVEEMMTTTILIGRAISAVQFPGMYRIYDFHSSKAPKLKNAQQIKFTPFFAPDSDDDDDNDGADNAPDPADYEHFFHVKVGEDVVYIEDPAAENDAGWTPLHACCMSLSTVDAGLQIIEELLKRGTSLESKTKAGPGTFNKGWTALQMACAYGVEPLVDKLIQAGADANARNSFGYSCLLEACHRGYINVVKSLLSGKADLTYIPQDELAAESPFASAPCQSALAEAARCGFFKVVQMLLDAGAPKDISNRLGWTALHEACFYNRMETVKALLLSGASATVRTRQGALPYHLACIPEIRDMIENMGGKEAVPSEGDKIDMLMILTELTLPPGVDISALKIADGDHLGDEDDLVSRGGAMRFEPMQIEPKIKSKPVNVEELGETNTHSGGGSGGGGGESKLAEETATTTAMDAKGVSSSGGGGGVVKNVGGVAQEEAEGGGAAARLLHSGPMLGNLPAFGGNKGSPPKKFSNDLESALKQGNTAGPHSSLLGSPPIAGAASSSATPSSGGKLSMRADGKDGSTGKKKKKKHPHGGEGEAVPKDMPPEFLCQLTRRPMSDPVDTVYGNVFDRMAIMNWLSTQGKICPLTGAPLAESDLKTNKDLGNQIKKWILMKSTGAADDNGTAADGSGGGMQGSPNHNNTNHSSSSAASANKSPAGGSKQIGEAAADDDLYDF
mmetsp:Transcript_32171/g.54252  ORF Transcript_32171/g.54252 Transcript_32171/m.54252 type:complete len:684 (+) Transcript_32171:94-2145(+)